jgi:hypothetical protein
MNRDVALRCLGAAALIGIVGQGLLFATGTGLNILLTTAAVLLAGWVVAGRGRRLDRLDAWMPIAALVIAAGMAIRSDGFTVLLDLGTTASLVSASMAAFAGAAVTRRSAAAIVALGAVTIGWMLAGILRLLGLARRPVDAPARRRLPAGAAPIARGLAIALPILFVFGALFASADRIFATLAENLFDWQLDLGQIPDRAVLAFVLTWIVAGLLAVAGGIDGAMVAEAPGRAPAIQSLGAAVARPLPSYPRLGEIEALTVLLAVAGMFGLFVGLQFAYLFGGLDTLAAAGITYSEYARRGFFELVVATALAGGLVIVLHAVIERRSPAFVAAALALAVLTLAILVSAAVRLRLYQDAYGWTELRFYVYATIGWLAIVAVAGMILLARDRLRWLLHAMTIAAVVVLAGVNLVGAQRHVADENVARLLDPSLVPPDGFVGLDEDYALWLGDDAVPALVRSLPALPAHRRATVLIDLERRWDALQQPDLTAWPAWNLARERARDALRPLFGP